MLTSVCCDAVPYEVTSIKEMSGTCKQCMKPTMFKEVKEDSLLENIRSMGANFDIFIDAVLGNEEENNGL